MFGNAHTHSSSKKPSMLRLSELFRDQGFGFRVARCAACAARLLVQKKRRAGNDPFVLHSPADRHVQLGLRARAKAAKWQTWNQESPSGCSSTYQKTCTAWGNIPPELHTSLQLATHARLLQLLSSVHLPLLVGICSKVVLHSKKKWAGSFCKLIPDAASSIQLEGTPTWTPKYRDAHHRDPKTRLLLHQVLTST